MGRLFLVRHAQASFLAPNYDKLSALGERQARRLGEYWARQGLTIDRVCSGPCQRHQETARFVAEAYQNAGRHFPKIEVLDEFDEFQGEAVLKQSLPQLMETDTDIAALYRSFQGATDHAEKLKTFERLFLVVIEMWIDGRLVVAGVEPWPEFCSRVNRGLTKFLSAGKSTEQSVVFSSGGPIGVAVQRALHLSAQDTFRMAWMSRNCSYSEFLHSGARFTLSTFNSFPHLDDASLLTHR